METTTFLTEKERARFERNEQIRSDYSVLRSSHPGISDNRIFMRLSEQYSLTLMSIRNIILQSHD